MKKKNIIILSVLVCIISVAVTAILLLRGRDDEVEIVEQDPHMYMAVHVFNREFGDYYDNITATYVRSDSDVHPLHYYSLDNTDMEVELRVLGEHNYATGPVTNIYGSDYSCVFFETDEVDRLYVYDYIYENASKSVYVLKPDLSLVDLKTGEVLDYGRESNGTAE